MAALLLGTAGLALAWATFRIERFGSRQRTLDGARAMLLAVSQALVSGWEKGKQHAGWGDITFSTVYTPDELKKIRKRARNQAQIGVFDQVFVVPTEPLEKLATSTAAPDLISVETLSMANWGLWRIHVFNQLVLMQTIFNAVTHLELRDAETTEARKEAIAQSAEHISVQLHHSGIDGAGVPEGWYARLTNAIEADIARLDEMRRKSLRRWLQDPAFAFFDVLVVAGVIAASILTGILGP